MCGIIAYIGKREAVPILVAGLRRLEYRGYDSAGLAVNEDRGLRIERTVGKVAELERKISGQSISGTCGLAHTRWATHGKPSEANAHPHTDCRSLIAVAHNGIIENYQQIKTELQARGHVFRSETDTEIVAHLIEENDEGDFELAVLKAVNQLEGTFGLALLNHAEPDKIIIVKRGSPIIIGIGHDELFAASDANALTAHTNSLIFLNDDEIAVLGRDRYYIKNLNNELLQKNIEIVENQDFSADKQGMAHFMLKEIFEQPETIENAFRGRLVESEAVSKLGGLETVLERLRNTRNLLIVSCGTSHYAGILGRYIFEHLTDFNVQAELASEFRYRRLKLDESYTVLAISQSGETADTLAAIKEAKRKGALVLGIVNVVGSAITQITEAGVYNHAGPEFGVASTKIYTSQIVVQLLIALLAARYQGLSYIEGNEIITALKKIPDQVREILAQSEQIRQVAEKYAEYRDFLYMGRLYNYPTAMEGALKLKEISYIHAEGYPAGEMKHGPISLIDENFPTVAIAPMDCTYEKMISNIQEIKARNGRVLVITNRGADRVAAIADDAILVPQTLPLLQPILNVIPLQLFAYYIALAKGCDIDKPRNLAKSVTVE